MGVHTILLVQLLIFKSVPCIVHMIRNIAMWIVEYVKDEINDLLAYSSEYQFLISLSLTSIIEGLDGV